ncbi:MAG: PQQ-binding-like beta-propeller repeat protein [Candidatus Bathyarchaeota archaeon]|nr:PQQ-binding-like beta-propeller repeat protein [Candidatus Bathyarchaeota archaeon]
MSAQANSPLANSGSLNQYEWPQFQGDSSFTRFSAGPAPDTPNILWKVNIPGIQSYIAAFNGMIFVCTNTSVVALDQTGKIVWETPIPMNRTWPIAYKIDDSHMIVESSCLDPKTGKLLWTSSSFCPDTGIFTANVYSPEEKMFYVKINSYIEAWDFSDPSNPPTLAWKTYIPGGGRTGIGTTYGDGRVFCGSFENQQIALDAKTGAILWTTLTKGPMIFNGAYSDGRFFRGGTDDNTLYCFNATSGQILWTYKPPEDTEGYFVTGCAVAYGMVYEMNKDGYLYAIDVESGNLVWRYKGPDESLLWPGMPAVADGKVYVTTGEVAMYGGQVGISEFACLNAFTGQPIWRLPIEALAPRESVAIAYGNLYIIPGNVTTSVDAISGNEYARTDEIWAIGSSSISISSWPMWRADPIHSSTAQVGPSNLTLAWKFTTDGSVISSPSVADGIVYVGSQDKNIYALGAWSGNLIWNFTTQHAIESSPAVANGKVYTGGDDGYVYCLNAYTGGFLWKTFINGDQPFTFGALVLKSSPTVSDGKVYVGSLDGYMYALDANNGRVVWRTKTGGQIASSPAVVDGAVYFTSEEPTEGALYKLDADTGDVIWRQALPYEYQYQGGTEMLGSPSVAAGLVFTSSNLRTYYGVNTTTGDIVWKFTNPYASEFIISSPIYVNGELFIIDKFNIACLNASNGNTLWSSFTGDELNVSPSYADGKIYIVTSQRHIYILDTTTNGTKIASLTTPSSCWSSPTIANGRLYVGCNDWNVYCFSNYITTESSTPSQNISTPGTILIIAVLGAIFAGVIVVVVVVGYLIKRRSKK